MVGRQRGFTLSVKEMLPTVHTAYCVLHRQYLVATCDKLHEAQKVCIKSINKVKPHPPNSRLLTKLCEENDETFNKLLLHTELR